MTDTASSTEADTDTDGLNLIRPIVPSSYADDVDSWGGALFLSFMLGSVVIITAGFFGLLALLAAFGDSESGSGGQSAGNTLEISVREFVIDGDLTAAAGEVNLNITNIGASVHNIVARELGLRSPDVGLGGQTELSLGELTPGSYELICDIPGHLEAGMTATLEVTP